MATYRVVVEHCVGGKVRPPGFEYEARPPTMKYLLSKGHAERVTKKKEAKDGE